MLKGRSRHSHVPCHDLVNEARCNAYQLKIIALCHDTCRFTLALHSPEQEEDGSSSQAAADGCNSNAAAGCAAEQEQDDLDADAEAILQLFPANIQEAICRLCRGQQQQEEQQQEQQQEEQHACNVPPRAPAGPLPGGSCPGSRLCQADVAAICTAMRALESLAARPQVGRLSDNCKLCCCGGSG